MTKWSLIFMSISRPPKVVSNLKVINRASRLLSNNPQINVKNFSISLQVRFLNPSRANASIYLNVFQCSAASHVYTSWKRLKTSDVFRRYKWIAPEYWKTLKKMGTLARSGLIFLIVQNKSEHKLFLFIIFPYLK